MFSSFYLLWFRFSSDFSINAHFITVTTEHRWKMNQNLWNEFEYKLNQTIKQTEECIRAKKFFSKNNTKLTVVILFKSLQTKIKSVQPVENKLFKKNSLSLHFELKANIWFYKISLGFPKKYLLIFLELLPISLNVCCFHSDPFGTHSLKSTEQKIYLKYEPNSFYYLVVNDPLKLKHFIRI